MLLGKHLMDLMRLLAGDARWCYARAAQAGKPVFKTDVREGGEGMGPVAGDQIDAMYGFDKAAHGYFATHRPREVERSSRFGLVVLGTKGIIQLTTGSLPAAFFLPDPNWFPGRSKAAW